MKREPTLFIGIKICLKDGEQLSITQHDRIKGIAVLTTEKEFRNQFALVQYIGVNYRTDVCAAVKLITPDNEIKPESQFGSPRKRDPNFTKPSHARA